MLLRCRWSLIILIWGLALLAWIPVHAQGGPFAAQIENFWALISTGGRAFTNINVTGGTITGVPNLGGNITGVSGSLLPPTTPLNGFTVTPVSQVKFPAVGTAEAALRTTNFFSYMTLPNASSATKAGLVSMVDVPNTNDGVMSGSARSFWGTVDLYGPTSHQYAGSVVGAQLNVGLHNTGGATNVFGSFTQALTDVSANVGQMRGGYFEANNSAPVATGNISFMYAMDAEVVAGAGSGTTTAYGVYTAANGPGDFHTFYGMYVDAPIGSPTFSTAKWSFYNNDATAPARSLSNWRAPLLANEASSLLSVASNTIAPTNGVHHVSAGLIKTITVPAMCDPTCTIALIPDAAFTYDATGNIVVPAGGGTATTSRVMTMTWDGSKWYPSY